MQVRPSRQYNPALSGYQHRTMNAERPRNGRRGGGSSWLIAGLTLCLLTSGGLLWWGLRDKAPPAAAEAEESPDTGVTAQPAPKPRPKPSLAGWVMDHSTRRGVPSARVRATCPGGADGTTVEAIAATSADGRFEILEPLDGECTLRASARGWVASGPDPEASIAVRSRRGRTLDGLELTLYKASKVLGRVTVDDAAAPGTTLSLLYLEAPGQSEPFGISADIKTDASGAFALVGLGPGRVQILAEHPTRGMAESQHLFLKPGQTIPDVHISLASAGHVHGRVIDPSGNAISEARVVVRRDDRAPRTKTLSGGDGTFDLGSVRAGTVAVTVSAHGFRPETRQPVEIEVDGRTELTFQLGIRPGYGGRVLAPTGEPAARAAVFLKEAGTKTRETDRPRTFTDSGGRFWIDTPPDKPSVVYARHAKYSASTERAVGGSERDLLLRLQAGGRLVGQVVDGRGEPISVYSVRLVDGTGQRVGNRRHAVRDPDGIMRVESVEPGRYALVVSPPGKPEVLTAKYVVVQGRDTDVGQIVVGDGGELFGQVVDGKTGEPVARASVTRNRRQGHTLTGSDGGFRLRGVAAGKASLWVRARGYRTRLVSGLTVEDGAAGDVGRVVLQKGSGHGSMEYSGIGIQVAIRSDRLIMQRVFPGGPAQHAGLRTGTAILKINGIPVADLHPRQAIEMIRGESGSEISLDVLQPGGSYPEAIQLERGDVVTPGR